jgi:hypothetical protein
MHAAALRWPGMRGLIVRKTRESLNESALVTYEQHVLPPGSPICQGAARNSRHIYVYPEVDGRKSEIVVGGLTQSGVDQKQRIMSTEFDKIYVQEVIELLESDWEKLSTRLRNGVMPYQQIIGDTNPGAPQHWIKRREKTGKLLLIPSKHTDNPIYWDQVKKEWTEKGKAYIARLMNLSGVERERLYEGKWVSTEGAVYKEWDRRIHEIEPFPIPDSWRRVRAIDFGFTNPFCCLWGAIDHDGRLYIYRQLYRTKRTVKVHAKVIEEASEGENIAYTVCDWDAEDRATLRECRIPNVNASKAIRRGIQYVEERLKIQGDGKPRLFVFKNSLIERDPELWDAKKPTCLSDEMDVYAFPPGVDGKNLKELPIDDNNHACFAWHTGIATEYGEMLIADIIPGRRVWTRKGLKKVVESGMTSRLERTLHVKMSNGNHLVGTGNHPVFVKDKGFVRLDSLRYGDILESFQDQVKSFGDDTWESLTKISAQALTESSSTAMTSIEHAGTSGKSSESTDTRAPKPAPVSVLSVSAVHARQPVWNLTVEGEHEYYASGVLVHNCDAIRYLVMSVDFQKPPDEPQTVEQVERIARKAELDIEEANTRHLMTYGWTS